GLHRTGADRGGAGAAFLRSGGNTQAGGRARAFAAGAAVSGGAGYCAGRGPCRIPARRPGPRPPRHSQPPSPAPLGGKCFGGKQTMIRKAFLLSLAFGLALALPAKAQDLFAQVKSGMPETVQIGDGQLKGYVADGIASFLGIPYAAPPVGDLRWKPPQ